jgi:hypothetical protein
MAAAPELGAPWRARDVRFELGGEAVPMKTDMSRFIPKDQAAGGAEGRVARVAAEKAVVGRAGNFREQKDLQLKSNPQQTPAAAEKSEAPMRFDPPASVAGDCAA